MAGRPPIRRNSSKVRFSRGDEMSPVGTTTSDTAPPDHPIRPSQTPLQPFGYASHDPHDQELHAPAGYTYEDRGGMAMSQSPSEVEYYAVPADEALEEELYQHQQQIEAYRTAAPVDYRPPPDAPPTSSDAYTSTPPRVGSGRRWTGTYTHRPTLDTLLSAETVDTYQLPVLVNANTGTGHDIGPPHSPRSGTYRNSVIVTGSPRHLDAQPREFVARSSMPNLNGSPVARALDQHRYSTPSVRSPVVGGFQGSPRRESMGFRRYDEPSQADYMVGPTERLSPVPPYVASARQPLYDQRSDWPQRTFHSHSEQSDRRSSSETLHESGNGGGDKGKQNGEYDEKSGYPRRDSDKAKYSPQPQRPWRRQRSMSESSRREANAEMMHRRTTRQVEADDDDDDASSYHVKGGVFSQLLRLAGRGSSMRRRNTSRGASSQGTTASAMGGMLPTMKTLGLKRADSVASTEIGGGDQWDEDDPRVTGQKKKKNRRRSSWGEVGFMRTLSAGMSGDGEGNAKRRRRRASVQLHVADILTRQQFILKLAKALMTFGAPSHRIESQLGATAHVLEIDAQFIHLPSIVIASFGDIDTRTSETHFVKSPTGLDLGKLHKTHGIYKAVVHDEIDAAEGTRRLHHLLKADMEYKLWHRICLAFLCSGLIAPMGFGGSILDGLASGLLGTLLSFLQLHVASTSAMYSNIFEISIAMVISFVARGLSTTGVFCYQAVASAGIVLILPGYVILCGSLELASKNIVSGSVRMVYAIIYSLFLGFGITIGSDLFYVLDRPARRASALAAAAANSAITLSGTFSPDALLLSGLPQALNASTPLIPFNGTFTFSNATTDAVSSNLHQGAIICVRDPSWPWWRQGMPQIYLIPLVPFFSLLLSMWNMQPLRSKQLPVMVVISCIGYFTNTLANHYIFDRSDVVSAIGAFVIGILGNIYSRVFGGTAFTSMVTGVLFLVPSGIAAAGGLAMSNSKDHGAAYSQGLIIGFRMVQVAIGITVGLFGSGLLIYSFGRKKGAALFAF